MGKKSRKEKRSRRKRSGRDADDADSSANPGANGSRGMSTGGASIDGVGSPDRTAPGGFAKPSAESERYKSDPFYLSSSAAGNVGGSGGKPLLLEDGPSNGTADMERSGYAMVAGMSNALILRREDSGSVHGSGRERQSKRSSKKAHRRDRDKSKRQGEAYEVDTMEVSLLECSP